MFARLIASPNVLVTGHQGFLTREALAGIASTTLANLDAFARGAPCPDALTAPPRNVPISPQALGEPTSQP
ncbi:MAG: hypothetical protein H0W72_04390 [Planctomycetes bacterium]|nr:hypothetical protein [Planctomycetota bacterium]